jgi:uncharacterized protein YdhG (YjbR/CyaY superfamily)
MNSTIPNEFRAELDDYKTAAGSIQFTVEKPLPADLVKKIVRARMAENDANALLKMEKKRAIKKIPAGNSTRVRRNGR